MQRDQKLLHQQNIEAYLQQNNVYAKFESLLTNLSLHQPEDPLSFMINQLSSPPKKLLFIQGVSTDALCEKVARQLGYEHLKMPLDSLEHTHEEILEYFEKNFSLDKNFVIQNFPQNVAQAQALQQSKIIPDLILFVEEDHADLTSLLNQKFQGSEAKVQNYLQMRQLNLNQVKKIYEESNYQVESAYAEQEIDRILNYNLKLSMKSPLRICLPESNGVTSHLCAEMAKKYDLVHIQVNTLVNEQIQRKTAMGNQLQNNQNTEQIVNDLVMMRLQKKDSLMQGFVLEGFPCSQGQISALVKNNFLPKFLIDVNNGQQSEFIKTVNVAFKNLLFTVENRGTQNMLEKIAFHITNFQPNH